MNTIIKNANVYDGIGHSPALSDIVVQDNIIKAVEPAGALTLTGYDECYDAKGLALAPGFIDAHSHSDTMCIRNPTCDLKILQGCTTEVVGNCGVSKCVEVIKDIPIGKTGMTCGWDDMAGYAAAVEKAMPAVNITTLVGHNSVRERVMGYENRAATEDEMRQMSNIITNALNQGACGLSSGLWYLPGKYSTTEEIVALGGCLRGTSKPYSTHMRSEGDGLLEALEEAIAVAANGAKRLEVSHIKASPKRNWNKIDAVIDRIHKAKADGLSVFADRYPYIYSATGLRMVLNPPWNLIHDISEYLRVPAQAEEVIKDLDATKTVEDDWKRIIVLGNKYAGKTVWEISQEMGVTPGTAVVRLLSETLYQAAYGKMSEDNMHRWLRQPWVSAGSDASAYPTDYSLGRYHPRAAGTFPLFFQIARQSCPTAEVIRRMTSMPAQMFNLAGRGVIRPGYIADMVVFDEENYQARSTFKDPHQPASGVSFVFVNGALAFDSREPDKIHRHGHFLKI
ncbi:MAG: amidohydrolase family protein [Victivallales bacterium]|nr:amidohydrolase family protein [Victivallales bacterium]